MLQLSTMLLRWRRTPICRCRSWAPRGPPRTATDWYRIVRRRAMASAAPKIDELLNREYSAGFYTDIESDTIPHGLNEDIVRLISEKKDEPAFMLEWRLK